MKLSVKDFNYFSREINLTKEQKEKVKEKFIELGIIGIEEIVEDALFEYQCWNDDHRNGAITAIVADRLYEALILLKGSNK